ncbi:MAG: leucyl/phenylalanyl-tRNA--protein transferase [Bacteroidota bacterium]
MSTTANPDLTPEVLIGAYMAGLFPMADSKNGPISWYSPDPRCILPFDRFHVSRSLRQKINRSVFSITVDKSFPAVIASCADRPDTWISNEIVNAYTLLHKMGFSHSVEAWSRGVLVGGLYGVAIRGAFFGESMFTKMTDASKVCLAFLVRHLIDRKFSLLDSQLMNDHIRQFGAVEVPRDEYLRILSAALEKETSFS